MDNTQTFTEKLLTEDTSIPPETKAHQDLGVLMHLFTFIGFPIVGPLIIWLIKKNESAYLDAQFRELMNFHISLFIAVLAAALLVIVCIGIPLLLMLGVAGVVLPLIGVIKASNGRIYRFPYIYRFL